MNPGPNKPGTYARKTRPLVESFKDCRPRARSLHNCNLPPGTTASPASLFRARPSDIQRAPFLIHSLIAITRQRSA